jgi:hypothetical protein
MAKGQKTGGRQKGTPNKRKRQAVVAEAIAREGEDIRRRSKSRRKVDK